MYRWPLKIIDMDSTHCPIYKPQPDLRDIFRINFQGRNISIEAPQRFHVTEQITQIIKRMREREDDSATKICTRCVAIPIILPRMPLWKIIAPMHVDSQHVTEHWGDYLPQ